MGTEKSKWTLRFLGFRRSSTSSSHPSNRCTMLLWRVRPLRKSSSGVVLMLRMLLVRLPMRPFPLFAPTIDPELIESSSSSSSSPPPFLRAFPRFGPRRAPSSSPSSSPFRARGRPRSFFSAVPSSSSAASEFFLRRYGRVPSREGPPPRLYRSAMIVPARNCSALNSPPAECISRIFRSRALILAFVSPSAFSFRERLELRL
mmetsp:Transcript_7810/g.15813  ORF Transcript_7810/g.15813 Transcript_7810/m.15813 type:complete len:203 (-) Transcript_7810:654-1262(-)